MLTRKQKEQIVEELADKIKRQQSLIFTDISGVNVSEMQKLRRELRQSEIEYQVAKKSLIDLALKQEKIDVDMSEIDGSVGLAFGYNDPILPAKIINTFSKSNENLKILGGVMENKFLDINEVKQLAMIPSKQELLGMFIGSLKAPITGFVNVLGGSIRNLVGVLNAIKEK
ncbi:50S ribosomal protein L10 [Patescibacteria group bacterium]|nr:50S ribosomal protein L10 [Patescibacteria group bacterium]MBU3922969.1 50S ribosomal protein L10 [Patescibacteria group bacterium]